MFYTRPAMQTFRLAKTFLTETYKPMWPGYKNSTLDYNMTKYRIIMQISEANDLSKKETFYLCIMRLTDVFKLYVVDRMKLLHKSNLQSNGK